MSPIANTYWLLRVCKIAWRMQNDWGEKCIYKALKLLDENSKALPREMLKAGHVKSREMKGEVRVERGSFLEGSKLEPLKVVSELFWLS